MKVPADPPAEVPVETDNSGEDDVPLPSQSPAWAPEDDDGE